MRERYYLTKIFILLFATAVGVFVIWWSMIREEGADWISGQIVHEASPFAITRTDEGTIVSNVISGYEFTVPAELKVSGSKNLIFVVDASEINCQIKHSVKIMKGQKPGEEKEINWRGKKLNFIVISDPTSQASCEKYFEQIRKSLIPF